ncbi:MAG TPA: DUF4097 family beta strand repeat-containing protein [Blastocatellia bacterium]|nr:DUF4097 family beta strand repeat-containing protein [Blastocatellia bacterium]
MKKYKGVFGLKVMRNRNLIRLMLIVTAAAVATFGTRLASGGTIGAQEHKLGPGGRIIITNPNGPISITGWDKDVVKAVVEGEEGRPNGGLKIAEDSAAQGAIFISPDEGSERGGELHIVVQVPVSARIERASTGSGDIVVNGVSGSTNIATGHGDVRITNTGPISATSGDGRIVADHVSGSASLHTASGDIRASGITGAAALISANGDLQAKDTGPLEARSASGSITVASVAGNATLQTQSGDVDVKNVSGDLIGRVVSGDIRIESVSGLLNLAVTSGDVTVANNGGDIKITSISGGIHVVCAGGGVEVNTANGSINLSGIKGNVEAISTSGEVGFTGAIRANGRYRLKSTSGDVRMMVQPDPPGFTAALSSYSGEIDTIFPIHLDTPMQQGPVNRRIIGRFGDGRAEIRLDSFSGTVTLSKMKEGAAPNCK